MTWENREKREAAIAHLMAAQHELESAIADGLMVVRESVAAEGLLRWVAAIAAIDNALDALGRVPPKGERWLLARDRKLLDLVEAFGVAHMRSAVGDDDIPF